MCVMRYFDSESMLLYSDAELQLLLNILDVKRNIPTKWSHCCWKKAMKKTYAALTISLKLLFVFQWHFSTFYRNLITRFQTCFCIKYWSIFYGDTFGYWGHCMDFPFIFADEDFVTYLELVLGLAEFFKFQREFLNSCAIIFAHSQELSEVSIGFSSKFKLAMLMPSQWI